MKKVYLIRHGQSTGDEEGRYGGDYDDDLTAHGREQVALLADELASAGIQYIYNSPLKRAAQTAEILAMSWQVQTEIVKNIRERNRYGIITGVTKIEAAERYPEAVAQLADFRSTIQGGEAYEPFRRRIESAIKAIASNQFSCVGVVTHGGPISTVMREMLSKGEVLIADCGYVALDIEQQTLRLLASYGIDFNIDEKVD